MNVTPSAIAVTLAISFSLLSGTAAPAAAKTLIVPLAAVDKSGETGVAKLADSPAGLVITVTMKNPLAAAQPVHIHPGTCANSVPQPLYPLTTALNGSSKTTLKGVKLAALLGKNVINVHKSTAEMGTYVSCGPIAG